MKNNNSKQQLITKVKVCQKSSPELEIDEQFRRLSAEVYSLWGLVDKLEENLKSVISTEQSNLKDSLQEKRTQTKFGTNLSLESRRLRDQNNRIRSILSRLQFSAKS